MKVKRSTKPGKVTVELSQADDVLLEKSASLGGISMQTILVPIDFSDFSRRALEFAAAFATQFQASVVLVHVVEPMAFPENCISLPAPTDDINGSLIKAADDRLAAECRALEKQGIEVKPLSRLGRPYLEIADAARELGADLIVLATHGHTGLRHVLLGSTAERVVRHAPCPVLTVRDTDASKG